MKQPQSNTALLAHKWTFTQFPSGRTLRPQRTQLLSIVVTPLRPPPLLRQGICDFAGLPCEPFSGAAPSPNHEGAAPNFRDAERVTLPTCQALSRVRLSMARLQWSARPPQYSVTTERLRSWRILFVLNNIEGEFLVLLARNRAAQALQIVGIDAQLFALAAGRNIELPLVD